MLNNFISRTQFTMSYFSTPTSPFQHHACLHQVRNIYETPYYVIERTSMFGVSVCHSQHCAVYDRIKYLKTKQELKTMVEQRNLGLRKLNGSLDRTWLSNANKWELVIHLDGDYEMRELLTPIVFGCLCRFKLPYQVIDIIISFFIDLNRAHTRRIRLPCI